MSSMRSEPTQIVRRHHFCFFNPATNVTPKIRGRPVASSMAERLRRWGAVDAPDLAIAGAVTVSVEVMGLVLGTRDAVEKSQVGMGDGPVTRQESWTVASHAPPTGAIVIMSVACPPACKARVSDAGVIEKLGAAAELSSNWPVIS